MLRNKYFSEIGNIPESLKEEFETLCELGVDTDEAKFVVYKKTSR